jgi:hypothetical protein
MSEVIPVKYSTVFFESPNVSNNPAIGFSASTIHGVPSKFGSLAIILVDRAATQNSNPEPENKMKGNSTNAQNHLTW